MEQTAIRNMAGLEARTNDGRFFPTIHIPPSISIYSVSSFGRFSTHHSHATYSVARYHITQSKWSAECSRELTSYKTPLTFIDIFTNDLPLLNPSPKWRGGGVHHIRVEPYPTLNVCLYTQGWIIMEQGLTQLSDDSTSSKFSLTFATLRKRHFCECNSDNGRLLKMFSGNKDVWIFYKPQWTSRDGGTDFHFQTKKK